MTAFVTEARQLLAGFEWWALLLALWPLVALGTAGHALLTKRDARAAWGWIAVCWLFPLAGPALYYVFGVNRVRTHAKRFAIDRSSRNIGSAHSADIRNASSEHAPIPSWLEEVARTSDVLTRRPLLGNNTVTPLHNGEQAYPRMLAAIAAARETIWLGTYIFDNDAVGQQFVAALSQAKSRGVQVKVLIDDTGERYSWPRIGRRLKQAGIDIARFNPLCLWPPALHLNLRNHRKLLLIDGGIGFTGGMNIGARHLVDDPHDRRRTIDLHFELRGPIVRQMADVFAEDWNFAAREQISVHEALPPDAGSTSCRVITDGPNEDFEELSFVMMAAIAAARREVLIMTPYFLPPAELIAALQGAALRGVRTVVLLPKRNNLPYVGWAAEHQLAQLLERGVRIRFQTGPFCHSKLFVVDGAYAMIGSANWDPRSLLLNFELNVEIYDNPLAQQLATHFANAWQNAEELLLHDAQHPRFWKRLRSALFWLFSPYL